MKNLCEKGYQSVVNAIGMDIFKDPYAYSNWLAQTYYYVCHSVKLLALSISRMSEQDKKMMQRFIKHIGEENNHELLALSDLKAMGYELDDFPELPQTRSLYETQYYKINYLDSSALLGYIIALEFLATKIGPEMLVQTKEHPSFKFLKLHVEEDVEHVDMAINQVESLAADRVKIISENLEQTFAHYKNMLEMLAVNKNSLKEVA